MPIVNIHMLEGRSLEKKRELVEKISRVIMDTLGAKPEKVRVILSEMKHDNFAIGGILHSDETK
jgi:4-oxalocrotonate tautomerase